MTSDSPGGWQAVRDLALARILDGRWPPGSLIPTETELAAEFGCARATMNRALRSLAERGLLDRRRRAGTRVAAEPVRKVTLTIPLVRRQIEAGGAVYSHHAVRANLGPPPLPGPWLAVETMHFGDGAPRVHEARWISKVAVPQADALDLAALNLNEWLVRNVPYTAGALDIEAVQAGHLAAALGCDPAAAVLRTTRTTWLQGAWVTHAVQTHVPGYTMASVL